MPGQTTKTQRQVAYLLSKGSPLTPAQKAKLQAELDEGIVKVVKDKPGKA